MLDPSVNWDKLLKNLNFWGAQCRSFYEGDYEALRPLCWVWKGRLINNRPTITHGGKLHGIRPFLAEKLCGIQGCTHSRAYPGCDPLCVNPWHQIFRGEYGDPIILPGSKLEAAQHYLEAVYDPTNPRLKDLVRPNLPLKVIQLLVGPSLPDPADFGETQDIVGP